MENYTRLRTPRPEETVEENELRITSGGKSRNYISYANTLFTEKGLDSVILRAMGKAINKTVAIAEIMKRRVEGLHQSTVISSTDITDIWEPKVEGLDRIETVRHVSVVTITLSKEAGDTAAPGYQAPLSPEDFKPVDDEGALAGEGEDNGEEGGRSRRSGGRGRGRGRGRPRPKPVGENGEEAPAREGAGGGGGGGGGGNRRHRRGGRGGRQRAAAGEDGGTAEGGAVAVEAAPPTAQE